MPYESDDMPPSPRVQRTLRRQVMLLLLTLAVVAVPNILSFAADVLEY